VLGESADPTRRSAGATVGRARGVYRIAPPANAGLCIAATMPTPQSAQADLVLSVAPGFNRAGMMEIDRIPARCPL
jgi:hypothetical protein